MTVEDCREILKVHVNVAESAGKMPEAFALVRLLTDIDAHRVAEMDEKDW